MKPILEKIDKRIGTSFKIKKYEGVRFDAPWHFHPEFELTYILKSKGKRYVGDSIESYEEGDLVLIGEKLPHCWINEVNKKEKASAIVIQFSFNFLGDHFFDNPELVKINQMLNKSKNGIYFKPKIAKNVGNLIKMLLTENPVQALLKLLTILDELSITKESKMLSSDGFRALINATSSIRIDSVYTYIVNHFKNEISQKEAAKLIGMSPAAFSRYFKNIVKCTFAEKVTEFRIGYACKLLVETDLSISEIGYESGYSNLSNFHRYFQKKTGMTPREFRLQL